jgi:hypothetical protein
MDAAAFSGPGVETLENLFEGDDDDVPVKCAILKTKEPVERVLAIDPANAGVRLRRVLDQSMGPQQAEVSVDGAAAGTWYDPDRNPWKRLAESDFEIAPALLRGKSSIKVAFRPQEGPWTIGELRAFSHVDRPLGETTGKERYPSSWIAGFVGLLIPLSYLRQSLSFVFSAIRLKSTSGVRSSASCSRHAWAMMQSIVPRTVIPFPRSRRKRRAASTWHSRERTRTGRLKRRSRALRKPASVRKPCNTSATINGKIAKSSSSARARSSRSVEEFSTPLK